MPSPRRFFQVWSSPSSSTPTMASTCTPAMAQGRHVFEINGYSKQKGIGHAKFVRSVAFSVGGHRWSIRFYPDGLVKDQGHISVYLELMSEGGAKQVRASCDLKLINHSTGLPSLIHKTELRIFNSGDVTKFAPQTSMFKKKTELEAYLKDDRLVIECVVTVIADLKVSETQLRRKIEVPPSDIGKCLGKFLEAEEGVDVRFRVQGEIIAAHKLVLAMRSPVFKAEFYGPMRERSAQLVTIEDMQPAVFRALLHFIYTDSLPDMDDLGGDGSREMIQHLLVAADRYAVDRLKLACESILYENLDVKNVATTFALAYQHGCNLLQDACLEYISSTNVMDAVVATQGYKNLKTACPSALADAFEKMMTLRRT